MCTDFTLPHCHHHGPQGDDPYPAEGEPGKRNLHTIEIFSNFPFCFVAKDFFQPTEFLDEKYAFAKVSSKNEKLIFFLCVCEVVTV